MKIKRKTIIITIAITSLVVLTMLLIDFIQTITNKTEGSFGQSQTKEQALTKDLFEVTYTPSKDTLILLDGRSVVINDVWAEKMWSYHNNEPKEAQHFGYNLQVEFQGNNDDFVFTFDMLNKENQAFTNGIGNGKCVLNPKELFDTIDIILEEKNPKDGVGWTNPLTTDTITLTKK